MSEQHKEKQANPDALHWYEKGALGLAMAAQSLVIMQWYLDGHYPAAWVQVLIQWRVVVVAVAAGIALDAVVVTTTMGRREGRQSVWGWLTAFSAAIFSAAVALHMNGGWSAGPWLHIAYPVTTFLFAQHLATPRKQGHADAALDVATTLQPAAIVVQAPQAEAQAIEADVDTPLLEVDGGARATPAIQALLDGVPQVVYLKDVEGLSFTEIGKRLGKSRQAVQQQYSKALQTRKGV